MKIFFKLLLASLLIAIASLGFMGYNRFQSPTTVEMKDFFTAHRTGFEQKNTALLSALAQKATINTGHDAEVGYQWLETQPGPDSYQDGEPVKILYYTHLRGIGVGSFGTGIAYIEPAGQVKTYPNLEAMLDDAKKSEGFIGYSRIVDNWYCFFWEAD